MRTTKTAYYFGCWSKDRLGHHLYEPSGQTWHQTPAGFPINRYEILDAGFLPPGVQTEGEATFVHINGWTILSFWDRSADSRPGSSSSFVFQGTLDFDRACGRAEYHFASVWERFKFPVVERSEAVQPVTGGRG